MADGAEDGVTLDRPFGPGISKMSIRGNVVEEIKLSTPIATMQEYCKLKLNNKLRQLESVEAFAPSRQLLSPLRSLCEERLPNFNFDEMFKQSAIPTDTFQFTHYDLFPRNSWSLAALHASRGLWTGSSPASFRLSMSFWMTGWTEAIGLRSFISRIWSAWRKTEWLHRPGASEETLCKWHGGWKRPLRTLRHGGYLGRMTRNRRRRFWRRLSL